MVKVYLVSRKTKPNGKKYSHVHLRKYHDAIMYGAKKAKTPLPVSYYTEMDGFLTSFRKETAEAKKDGMLDEKEADPISWTLFRHILQWALGFSNYCVCFFSILQWNCMARSVNISVLLFHNFRVGKDSITCKYDRTKSDQSGNSSREAQLRERVIITLSGRTIYQLRETTAWYSVQHQC